MKDWFNALQPRERLTITACTIVTAIAFIYLLVWAPIADGRAQLEINVKAQRETLAWMRQAGQQVQEARRVVPSAMVNDPRSLLSIVDSSAEQGGVRDAIERMEPEGDDGVKLSMEDAGFDATIQWLGALKRSHNVDVVSASITPSEKAGQVDTRLSLQRP